MAMNAAAASNWTLLARILHGTAPSQFILVEDTVGNDGHPFFYSLLRQISQRANRVHFVTADCTSASFLAKYEPAVQGRFEIHKFYEDPFGWNELLAAETSSSTISTTTNRLRYNTDLNEYLFSDGNADKAKDGTPSTSLVVLDCLSTMLLQLGLAATSQMLTKLIQNDSTRRLLCLLHADVHEDFIVDTMEYMSNTVIRLDANDPSIVRVTHKYSTGKVIKEMVKYATSAEKLEFTELSKATEKGGGANLAKKFLLDDNTVHQLASSLTFNVSLKNEEKQSRASLVLPYEKASNQTPSPSGGGGGRILYEPDAGDDFDEEDPDDDLGF